jgi:ligand-binding sensor domain-containing protein/signal transduction histidine kinase
MKSGFFSLFILLIFLESKAQPEQIRFRRLSIEEGLSQSTVTSILNDSDGYMWFGTRDGLNRYDGNKITIFRHDPTDSTSISSSEINSIFEDKRGDLWILTTKGIDRFNRQIETFVHYDVKKGKTKKRNINVTDLLQDKRGDLWLGSYEGLYKYDPKEQRFTFFDKQPDTVRFAVRKLMEDNQGYLWMSSIWFVARFDPVKQSFKYFSHEPNNRKSLSYGFHPFPYQDKKGRIWIGSIGGGVCLYNPEADSFTRFFHDAKNPNSLCHNEVMSMADGPDDQLWIGTQNGGISVFNYKKNIFKTLQQDIKVPSTITNNSIHSLYKDKTDNMWVGTWAGGVNFYSRYGIKFTHYKGVLGFNNPNIYEVTGDSEGNIWVSVEDGGLVRFERETGSFKFYPNQNAKKFLTTVIFSIEEYNRDTLAITYHRGNFAFFDKGTGLFTHFFSKDGSTKPVVIKDGDGNLWLGDWGNGLDFYDRHTKTFTSYGSVPNDSTTLNGTVVFAIVEDKQGTIWVGTDNGLNRFDRKSHHFVRYPREGNPTHSLSGTVFSLFEDSRGTFWIGTAGEGLVVLDRRTNRFIRYPELHNLPNKVINGILEDNKGNLWISTNKGLSRYNLENKTIRNYDVHDGLQGNEFNRNACYKAHDGTMFFAGTNGLSVFHPDSIKDNPHSPPVVITDFQLFNKSVAPAKGSVLEKAINESKEITLSYMHSVFSFEFAALDFSIPGNNQYAYKMERFDKDWIYSQNRHLATYTNLDPGKYTFRVKASNNDGKWNEIGAAVIINITPPWWKTWWFQTMAALVIICLGPAIYFLRIRNIKEQNKKLEALVNERTRELQNANLEIRQMNEELSSANIELVHKQEEIVAQRDMLAKQNQNLQDAHQIIEKQNKEIMIHNENLDREVQERTQELMEYNQQLEQFAFITAHNLRAPVARILGLGQLLNHPEIFGEEEKMILKKLSSTTEELDRVIKDVSSILEIRKNYVLVVAKVDLKEELAAIRGSLEDEILNNGVTIIEDFSEAPVIYTVKAYLDSILMNLIHNAIKYRNPQRPLYIEIKSKVVDDYICISVKDNGLGIDLELHQQNLFKLYKRFHFHVKGKGIGLNMVKTEVTALGGKIEVESKVDVGTTFHVFLKKSYKPPKDD